MIVVSISLFQRNVIEDTDRSGTLTAPLGTLWHGELASMATMIRNDHRGTTVSLSIHLRYTLKDILYRYLYIYREI